MTGLNQEGWHWAVLTLAPKHQPPFANGHHEGALDGGVPGPMEGREESLAVCLLIDGLRDHTDGMTEQSCPLERDTQPHMA